MMKFLIDNALSPLVAKSLYEAGYDAIHVRDIGLHNAADIEIFRYAGENNRIVVSADTDFGTLLAIWEKSEPSVILFRRVSQRRPQQQAALLLANLLSIEKALKKGSIVVIEEKRIRIRDLPIN